MKRLVSSILLLMLFSFLCGCTLINNFSGNDSLDMDEELIVFAAASMTESLSALQHSFEQQYHVRVIYNFDSSGTLKTQIEQGAACDVFISAGQKQMDQLEHLAENVVVPGSRITLLQNKIALCVTERQADSITSFEQLAEHLQSADILFCMANADVPVGQYTGKILEYYGLCEQELSLKGVITYGSNVKEVTTQLLESSVDAGVVYCTDAFSAGLTPVDVATEEMCGLVIYPACIISTGKQKELAKRYIEFLRSEEAASVFSSIGFTPVSK